MDKEKIKMEIIEFSSNAKKYDELKDYEKAFDFYLKAANNLNLLKKEEKNEYIKNEYIKQAKEYALRAKEIRDNILPNKANIEFLNKNLEENKKINVKWEDIVGLEKVKSILKENVISPLCFPQLIKGNITPCKTILLYGAVGTGKRLLVKAAATELQKSKGNFISISNSSVIYNLISNNKLYNDLIDFAIKKKPVLIFIDNITCFISNNDQFKGNFEKDILNIFNTIEKNEGIILIATDNYPWNLETTFLSKFQKKIYIPLPDFEAKKQILKLNMKNIPNTLTEEQIEDIIKETNPLLGGEIASLTGEASFYPFKKCMESEYFKKIPGINGKKFNYVPCTENEPGAIKMKLNEIPKEEISFLLPPKVEYQDFINADKRYTCKGMGYPSFMRDIEKLKEFTKKFGEEG